MLSNLSDRNRDYVHLLIIENDDIHLLDLGKGNRVIVTLRSFVFPGSKMLSKCLTSYHFVI